MRKITSSVYIGTSGYRYFHWYGVFYPETLKQDKFLEYYSKFFDTVELNVTFYRLPEKKVFRGWYERTPQDFYFTVKASRTITHVKKLKSCEDAVTKFFDRIKELREKVGVILWQLPPSWKRDVIRLESFCTLLYEKFSSHRHVFEFRHQSWCCDDVYKILKRCNFGFCIADSPYWPLVEKVTADFAYLRFHGSEALYASNYSISELKHWARKIKDWLRDGVSVYAYFNNDAEGYAVKNALTLKELVKQL
jgi:uncharacterized protein YecE (DUF72 family)